MHLYFLSKGINAYKKRNHASERSQFRGADDLLTHGSGSTLQHWWLRLLKLKETRTLQIKWIIIRNLTFPVSGKDVGSFSCEHTWKSHQDMSGFLSFSLMKIIWFLSEQRKKMTVWPDRYKQVFLRLLGYILNRTGHFSNSQNRRMLRPRFSPEKFNDRMYVSSYHLKNVFAFITSCCR